MTYPCNHRGGLRHSEIKHMGKRERRSKKEDIFIKRVVERERIAHVSATLVSRKIVADWLIHADFV